MIDIQSATAEKSGEKKNKEEAAVVKYMSAYYAGRPPFNTNTHRPNGSLPRLAGYPADLPSQFLKLVQKIQLCFHLPVFNNLLHSSSNTATET